MADDRGETGRGTDETSTGFQEIFPAYLPLSKIFNIQRVFCL